MICPDTTLICCCQQKNCTLKKYTVQWLADSTGKPLNYARIQVNGHLKSNPAIPLAYQGNVIALCTEGKYIIGFVNVAKSGIYQLNATIDNFGQVDTFSYEIEIGE